MAVFDVSEPLDTQRGFALFALGFRPFFLLAGIAAMLLPPIWVAVYAGWLDVASRYGALGWHAHEMLFGYAVAVIAGFLLTAVRNWTGVDTATGRRLAGLAALWVAGRILPFTPAPEWLVSGVDLLFLPALAVALGFPLIKARQPHNLVFLPMLAMLTIANLLIHSALLTGTDTWRLGIDLAVGLIVALVVLVGGRVVPFFIERGLPGTRAPKWPMLERLVVASVLLWLITKLWAPASPYLGLAAAAAALLQAVRIGAWYTPRIWGVPLLWVLYLGFAWMVVGFTLDALSGFEWVASTLALHAFTTGTIGVMTLGMMARVALGHTGRPMRSSRAVNAAFALVNVAAVIRIFFPLFMPAAYLGWVVTAAFVWMLAFLLFVTVYTPVLIRPRIDGQPG